MRTLSWPPVAELFTFLLPALPLRALLLTLLFGHYPGCEAIVRFRSGWQVTAAPVMAAGPGWQAHRSLLPRLHLLAVS
jgi:hypothetical protein